MTMDPSAAVRSSTASVNVTVTGCATPTVCPGPGDTLATVAGEADSAEPEAIGPAIDSPVSRTTEPVTDTRRRVTRRQG